MESSSDVLERIRVREVVGVFRSPRAIDDAVEDLLLNSFDRADLDQLNLDEFRRRLGVFVPSEDAADISAIPRQPAFTRDDITVARVAAVSLVGAAAGTAIAFGVLTSGGSDGAAAIFGTLTGLFAGTAAALVMSRAFRGDDAQGLKGTERERGSVLCVRVRAPEQEAKAQEILLRNGGYAVRVHEIEIEKRTEDITLSWVRPDPWLGSEQLGHP